MTMLLAINFGEYGIIAADKAAVNQKGLIVEKDHLKIKDTNIGKIAGTGQCDIIFPTFSNLSQEKTNEEIIQTIHQTRFNFLLLNQEPLYESAAGTGFLILSKIDNEIKLSYFTHEKEYKSLDFIDFKKDHFIITPPFSHCKETYKKSKELIKNLIKRDRDKETEVLVIKEAFKMMSGKSTQMTEEFDLYFV